MTSFAAHLQERTRKCAPHSRFDWAVEAAPRLLYVGDVPVTATVGGSLALYRLLQDYPTERLACLHLRGHGRRESSLPGVLYETAPLVFDRLQRTRLARWLQPLSQLTRRFAVGRARRFARRWGAEAVLTVAHGDGWLTAAAVARNERLPLHLIVHDAEHHWGGAHPLTGRLVRKWFCDAYGSAASRLCVSPKMAMHYQSVTGCPGDVLYPMRSAQTTYTEPPPDLETRVREPVAAYFGTINSPTVVAMLDMLAELLQRLDGRLLVMGPLNHHMVATPFLQRPNVEHRGFMETFEDVQRLCRHEATFLYLPFPFEEARMSLSFPSKFVDYTTLALPVLAHAPHGSTIVNWAGEHPDTLELVTTLDPDPLERSLHRLVDDPTHARSLGASLAAAGEASFGASELRRRFFRVIEMHQPRKAERLRQLNK